MFDGIRLKKIRQSKKISQELLAEKLNIHVNTIRRWEQNKQTPDAKKLEFLAENLGVSISDLMGEADNVDLINENSNDLPIKNAVISPSSRNSKWMLIYERNGERMEMPPTPEGYSIFREIASTIANRSA